MAIKVRGMGRLILSLRGLINKRHASLEQLVERGYTVGAWNGVAPLFLNLHDLIGSPRQRWDTARPPDESLTGVDLRPLQGTHLAQLLGVKKGGRHPGFSVIMGICEIDITSKEIV
jgi:hypothetical protein